MALTQVSSGLISSVANTAISGNIISSQITSVANTQVTGLITASQIATVANTQVTGLITSGQIASVANTQVTGLITSGQIASLANTQITGILGTSNGGTGQTSLSAVTVGNATNANTATNLAGGGAGQVPYNTGSGATSFLAAGSSGQFLKSNGASAPSWGCAGSSTTYGAVGTYVVAYGGNYATCCGQYVATNPGSTFSGACLFKRKGRSQNYGIVAMNIYAGCGFGQGPGGGGALVNRGCCTNNPSLGLSGTWRSMTYSYSSGVNYVALNLFVRVS